MKHLATAAPICLMISGIDLRIFARANRSLFIEASIVLLKLDQRNSVSGAGAGAQATAEAQILVKL